MHKLIMLSLAGTTFFSGTWSMYTGALFLVLGCLFYYFSISTYGYWRKRNVPYGRPLPMFGNFATSSFGIEHISDLFNRLYKHSSGHKYWGIYQMRAPTLMLRDPDLITKVLIKDFSHFTDHGVPVDVNTTPLTNHLFTMKGQKWKIMRSKMSPVFTSSKLKNMQDQINECGDQLMKNLEMNLIQSDMLEVRDIMGDYSTDVIGTCAFGLQLNAIVDKDSQFRKAGKAVFTATLRNVVKDLITFISPSLRKMLKIGDFPPEASGFFESSFNQTMAYRTQNNIVRNDLVQCLMQARQDLIVNKLEPSVIYRETDIAANAFLMFLAGFETVSTTMSYCLYELALKNHIQDRVRDEILTAMSKHNSELNNDFLTELSYLEMVISETLRMYPPLSIIIREATKSYKVPGEDLVIEKGTKIAIPAYSLHMDPMYYPDPNTFNPERFTPEEKAKRPSGVYMPFGEGPRICLGKRFAEMEMKLALSKLLTMYQIEPCEKTDVPMKPKKLALTTVPENGIWLRFKQSPIMLSLVGTSIFTGTCFMYTCALFLVLGCLLYYFSISTYGYWRKRNVPYGRPLPMFGNFATVIFGIEHISDLFNRLYKQSFGHKYWGIYQMRAPTLMLRDPDLITKVLIKDFSHFTDKFMPLDVNATPLSNHLFAMKGQKWKIMRSKISSVFTSSKLKNMHYQIKECSDQLMKNLEMNLIQSDVLEVRDIMGDYSTDVIGTCAFGLQLNAIVDKDSQFRKAGKAVFTATLRLLMRDVITYISPSFRKMLNFSDYPPEATQFFESSLNQTMDYRRKNNIVRNDLVQCLMQARQDLIINKLEPSVNYKETDIAANAFITFLAGFETVSTTMSYCLYELALKNHIQDRVRDEILTAMSKHNSELNNDFLTELSYLEMVISETLRMYPPLSIIFREASESYKVHGEDLVIEKGTKIAIPAYSLHMDPMYYPDPITFNPERFTPEEKVKRPSGVYMPFGEGPRICLGKRFAEMEMKLALSKLLIKYRVEPCEKTDVPMKPKKIAITTCPENGIWLRFKRIDS
ncbi:LOW QUALITY PROTEIN: uncharacterized protein LOC126844826 [Adelges cooleyi]|uniref:LOW QUALITY PROTEIN: uncharacterized protein LOC126844826 n=1 Tax=Adelges cooleyi TaxID=133065 RepID=UPI0021802453|nr:LOW QUALITY PROTEIN: uncharacterized protein LOC126844826 [Adelges cooleyi]